MCASPPEERLLWSLHDLFAPITALLLLCPSKHLRERRKEGRGAEREQETRTYPLCLQVCAAETVHVLHRWSGAVVIVEKGAVQGLRYHVYPALTSLKFIIWNLLN